MPRKDHKKPYDLYIRIDFGKHKGTLIQDIIQTDPDYLLWCLDNVDGFFLTKEAEYQLDGV